jgi:glycosyltransferase involved in cell wall biosynthesis
MKKICVLFTIPNFDTAGSGKALLNLALGLDSNRFEPHILCLSKKGEFFSTVQKSGIPVHVFNYLPKERPVLKMLYSCYKVAQKIKDINPDIVHSFHYSSNYTEAIVVKLAGKKWIFTKKNMSWGGSSKNSWKLRSWFADKIIIQNTDMKREFYPTSTKTVLIPRGVDTKKFEPKMPNAEILKFMNTSKEERILICVANFVPVKGIEILIEAFCQISALFPKWKLWLVGDHSNEYGKKLKKKVIELSMTDKIIFSGKVNNVNDYLQHAEIFVLPTKDEGRKEGSPVAMLEAMANGKVVIGSAISGIKDQLQNFQNHLFQPGSSEDLKHKLEVYFENSKEENVHLGKQFIDEVSLYYSINDEVIKHESVYLSLF